MHIENLRSICLSFPGVTEDIKWGNHLTFLVGGKLFCMTDLDETFNAALKAPAEDFDDLVSRPGIRQAAHFARRQWIGIGEENVLSREEWIRLVRQSYDLVMEKLSRKLKSEILRIPDIEL